ncbi:MAG: NHL repeat-containing protein, partial [Elusimicrobia bacterium]|nr:NHL repeat-containing protein [Elusimicrobiota bacterium]
MAAPVAGALTTGQNAGRVIGKPDFTTAAITAGGLANTGLGRRLFVDSNGKLFVSDAANHRVLIWNSLPTSNGVPADVVVGQANMNANLANRGGSAASASTLSAPAGMYSDGTKLYVADRQNNRVLIWNAIPTTNGAAANVVVGQPDMVATPANTRQDALSGPIGVWVNGGKLFVADRDNHRVLIWNTVPTTSGANADVVVGQPDFNSGLRNRDSTTANNSLSAPGHVSTDGTKLFIADTDNHRVLIFNNIPGGNATAADVAVGQPNLTTGSANQGGSVGATTLNGPTFVYSDGTNLFIADRVNNRVVIFNVIPSTSTPNAAANVAVGQTDLVSSVGDVSATGLSGPSSALTASGKLAVFDADNARVLLYNAVPTVHGTAANVVVGQTAMTNGCDNQRCPPAANRFSSSPGVFSTGSSLFVSDQGNGRVLRFNAIPTANGVSADVGIGVSNLTSVGGGTSQ